MRKYFVCLLGMVMVLGFVGMSSAAIVTDPTGDDEYPGYGVDIRAARAEQLKRGDGVDVLKVTYTASPNLGGIMVFEADVDSSTGTGGNLSMTGIPVTPCPCKTTPGIDVVIMMMNRDQDENSNSAMCAGCTDSAAASCAKRRYFGEYYAVAAGSGSTDTTGFLRGFADPTPVVGGTSRSYTFPWATILVAAKNEFPLGSTEKYQYADAIDPATTKWQLSVWNDPQWGVDEKDDFAEGATFFWFNDVVPNGNGNLVVGVDAGDALTYCEGNFDGDSDQDSLDAAKFKTDLGRSSLKNPCPTAGQYY